MSRNMTQTFPGQVGGRCLTLTPQLPDHGFQKAVMLGNVAKPKPSSRWMFYFIIPSLFMIPPNTHTFLKIKAYTADTVLNLPPAHKLIPRLPVKLLPLYTYGLT